MAKKQYFCIVDTETTIKGTVADFAALIVDRKGVIYHSMAALVHGHYGVHELFYDVNSSDEIWTLKGLEKRHNIYKDMLNSGERVIGSIAAINKWIATAQKTYPNLVFTAYNSAFDLDKMVNTQLHQHDQLPINELKALAESDINIHGFAGYFCMWRASVDRLAGNRKYLQYCLDNKRLTQKLQFKTDAETVAGFVNGDKKPTIEPHTALEDARDFELPILVWLLKNRSWRKYSQQGYNWRDWQLKNLVEPK